MKLQRSGFLAGIALTAAIALAACGSDNTEEPAAGGNASGAAASIACASGSLTAAGSTAQANAMSEWIKTYQSQCADGKINYTGNGSGAGVQAVIQGTADFAGSDSALKDDEQKQADAKCGSTALDIPMVVGPIDVVYNLQGVDGLQLDAPTLAKIFSGKITKWNDPAITAQNSGAQLPDEAIATVHRSDESGTTDNFTKYLSKAAEADWTFGNAKAWKAPGGTGAKGSDGVAKAVKDTAGALAYVEKSFADNGGLQGAKLKNGAGEYVELTPDSAGKGIAGAEVGGSGNNIKLTIDYNAKTAGAWPAVLVTYEIVCEKGSPKAPLLKSFFQYTSSAAGQAALTDLGYAPLPSEINAKVVTAVNAIS